MTTPDPRREREIQVHAEHLSFLEGPRWHDGRLWASDFFTRRVLAFGADGTVETICTLADGMPSGLGWDPRGRLLVSSMVDRRLLRLDSGGLVMVADLSHHAAWHCNDMVVDGQGRAYVGNFGWNDAANPEIQPTNLLRVDPDGRVAVAAEDVVFPNGVVITPDGATLLLAETFAGRITAFERAPDGSLSNRRTWAEFAPRAFATTHEATGSGVPLPDGMALDAEGALWIGDAAGNGALRVGEGGEILEAVPVGQGQTVFAVALGGPDRRTLFMCAAAPYGQGDPEHEHEARLLSCRIEVPGAGTP
ncbi:SMP-30/gluconolactonase/LRE family protein [Actinomadura mexicana]|uniref:Sugar lactone lactonase YvrE n=1 Tax=Actinomadura mexicana TaxID=134959 RepID=A0A238XGW9_9ACTN|nr:SMP-30/gluconolactonase/LRE family protein [Actinomadura mexicana]SNR57159.1 Sugar lactone lactonase YvrE [Actinomadura mexicana]